VAKEPAGSAAKIVRGVDGPRPRKDSPGKILPRGYEGAVPKVRGKEASTLNTDQGRMGECPFFCGDRPDDEDEPQLFKPAQESCFKMKKVKISTNKAVFARFYTE
jgi:hypothetical protein